MSATTADRTRHRIQRALGHDSPTDLAWLIGLFAIFAVVDRSVQLAARTRDAALFEPFLLREAVTDNLLAFSVLVVALVVAVVLWRGRLLAPWTALDHGADLRLVAVPLLVIVCWRSGLYEYNFLLDQWHTADRVLLLALGALSIHRPLFLIPFVIEQRLITEQFLFPFDATPATNIDELAVLALIALAAGHVVYVISGRTNSSGVVLLLSTLLAAHYFVPGLKKLAIGWVPYNELFNFPLRSYTTGWRGQGDGGFADGLADLARWFDVPVTIGTMLIEIGAVVAVVNYRVFRLFLPAWIVFHIVLFSSSGFWLFSWVMLEVILLVLMTRPRLQPWLRENSTVARSAVAVVAVGLLSIPLFHPPPLGWLDSRVSYGYRIEAVGVSGQEYNVPFPAFAPLDFNLTFMYAELAPTVSAGGAVSSKRLLDEVAEIGSFEELDDYERSNEPIAPEDVEQSELFLLSWLDHANGRGETPMSWIAPPSHFWTNTTTPRFDFAEPLSRVEVYRLRSLHTDDDRTFDRDLLLTLVVGPDGRAEVER